jgi:2,4-dienoyl-CoA reductase (NADPH2)
MTALPTLFSQVRIGRMQLRNRLVMSPMETLYGTRDGLPSERTIAYYEARSRGGVGLVTLGACTVDERHREVPTTLHFGSDAAIEPHRALTERVHAHGAKIQPQLAHPGPDGLAPYLSGIPNIGPSVIASYLTGVACRELEAGEIPGIVAQFAAAAVRVRAAGYDGIELHAAHGYMLLGSFLTPLRNRRTDAWGGQTPESRIRLIVEVVQAIKTAAGADFPLTLRISGFERVPGGRPIGDTQHIAPQLVAAGVDAFHVSGGVIDRLTSQMVTGSAWGDAHNAAAAAAVKRAVAVPVIAVGRIHHPELAEAVLRRGQADLVAMARPLLADPELPQKARGGRLREIRRCISCQSCIDSMETGRMGCAVNPFTGREAELSLRPAEASRRVVVVGGGPAGLEAARVAARRGHRVALYERSRKLGGALVLAAAVHPDNQPFLRFLREEIDRWSVEVHLGRELSAEDVIGLAPDAVVVATGGRLTTPKVEGGDLPHVMSGATLRAFLARRLGRFAEPGWIRRLSRIWMPLGRRVAIVGGDLAAVELAEFLAERGREVSLLERGADIAPEVGLKRRAEHMDRLDRLGVLVGTGTSVERIAPGEVWVRRASGEAVALPADSVVLAGEVEPDTTLYDAIRDRVPATFAAGDCTGLGLIRKATEEGARAACAI